MDALNRKEAIIMGDDITPVTREEYCLKELAAGGGSGSLDYVVPEQDVTFVTELESVQAVVTDVNVEGLQENNNVVVKFVQEGIPEMLDVGYYDESGNFLSFNEMGKIRYIQSTNEWIWQIPGIPEGTVATIAVISSF